MNEDEFFKQLNNQYGDKYKLVDNYVEGSKYILLKDVTARGKNYIWDTPKNILDGNFSKLDYINENDIYYNKKLNIDIHKRIKRIPIYKKGKYKITHEQFVKNVQDKFGDVYNILEEYKGVGTKIQVQHKCPDGDYYTWGITPSNLLNGKGLCPKCSNKERGIDAYRRKTFELVGDEYIVKSYTNAYSPATYIHNIEGCHYEFTTAAGHFTFCNVRCPKCSSMSRAEDKIEDDCIANSIPFIRQYTFDDCIYK